jgi:regulator of cell morphogenesis and NO signaling
MTTMPSTTLADLATTHPAASRIFHARGLDFCCHGGRPLEEACAEKGIDAVALLAEIETASAGDIRRWDVAPLGELIDYIVDFYHARLRVELPALIELAGKVETKHAEKAACPRGLTAHLRGMHEAVLEHLMKEERILFPLVKAGRGRAAAPPIQVMELEHVEHAATLRKTRELASNLVAPPEACASWQALYLRLVALELELMEHIHLENNVLFRRALCE